MSSRQMAVDRLGGALAVLDRLHRQVVTCGDAIAAGKHSGKRGFETIIDRDLTVGDIRPLFRREQLLADRLVDLVGKHGDVVARFAPDITPDDPQVTGAIEKELAKA